MSDDKIDPFRAPADYEELHRNYYDYVCRLVGRLGIIEREDVASEIMARFLEKDKLREFDPDLTFPYQGEMRRARFKTFLSAFVASSCKGQRDKERRLRDHERLLCDLPLPPGLSGGESGDTTWLEKFGLNTHSHEDLACGAVDEIALVKRIRDHLLLVPRRSQYDQCDLVALWDELVAQVRRYGDYNTAELRAHFHVKPTAIHTWLWLLKGHIAAALGRDIPPRRQQASRARP